MNGRRPSFFELISRLPPRIWLQAALGLIGFAILAVLGFAVIAGGVAIAVVILLIYRLRAWLAGVFAGRAVRNRRRAPTTTPMSPTSPTRSSTGGTTSAPDFQPVRVGFTTEALAG